MDNVFGNKKHPNVAHKTVMHPVHKEHVETHGHEMPQEPTKAHKKHYKLLQMTTKMHHHKSLAANHSEKTDF